MSSSDMPPEQPDPTGPDAGPSRTGGTLAEDEVTPHRTTLERVRGGYGTVTAPIRSRFAALGSWYRGLPKGMRWIVNLVILAIAIALPYLMPHLSSRSGFYVSLLVKIELAALLAIGLNVVVGFAGLLDLGYVAFFAIGAYTYAITSGAVRFNLAQRGHLENVLDLKPEWHMYFWLIFFVALVVAVLAGVILGAPTLRLRGDYLAIVTLGFGEIARIVASNLRDFTGGPLGVKALPHPEIVIGPVDYEFGLSNEPYYLLMLLLIIVGLFFVVRLNNSRVGRSWAAIREDELAAAAMGVPTIRMKLWAFAIGAAIAAMSGVVYATQISFINPDLARLLHPQFGSITVLAMVVLGGMGGIWGPIIGAGAVIFLPEVFRPIGDARFLVFGLALVLIMIVRPQGLIPSRRRAAELHGEVHEGSLFEVRESGA